MDRPFLIQDDDVSVQVRMCALGLVTVGGAARQITLETAIPLITCSIAT